MLNNFIYEKMMNQSKKNGHDFQRTMRGQKYFDNDLPKLIDALNNFAQSVELSKEDSKKVAEVLVQIMHTSIANENFPNTIRGQKYFDSDLPKLIRALNNTVKRSVDEKDNEKAND